MITWLRGTERWLAMNGMYRTVLPVVTVAGLTAVTVARVGLQGLDEMAAIASARPGGGQLSRQALVGTANLDGLDSAYRHAHDLLVVVVGAGVLVLTGVGVLVTLALVRRAQKLGRDLEDVLARGTRRALRYLGGTEDRGTQDSRTEDVQARAEAAGAAGLGDVIRAQAASVHLLAARLSELERARRYGTASIAPGGAGAGTEELPWWVRPAPTPSDTARGLPSVG